MRLAARCRMVTLMLCLSCSIVAPGLPISTGRKMTIAQRKLSSVSNKQTVRVLLVEPMNTQQRLAQSLMTKEGIYEVQASSEDMLERHARGASSMAVCVYV